MKFRKLAVILVSAIALCGCSKGDVKTDHSQLPPDTPYCKNIMETESGYYYNVTQTLSLRYTEKATGNDIFLCAKPECMHDGNEACTATYNNLIVTKPVLYNGYIYFLGKFKTKETTGYSLYKAALDGSSLDKITDVVEERIPPQYEECLCEHSRLIIHKGYAYVSYNIGTSYLDFVQSGFEKVDIQTGKTETIFKHDDYSKSLSYHLLAGYGDYFYYCDQNFSFSPESSTNICRYNIKTGESEKIVLDDENIMTFSCVNDENIYFRYFNREKEAVMLKGYNVETFEPDDNEINTEERVISSDVLFYDNKFIFRGDKEIRILSNEGELLGTFSDELIENSARSIESIFDISNGRIFMSAGDSEEEKEVFCCKIDDILNGKGEWEKAYTINHWSEYWDEEPIMNAFQTEEGE